ncbi:MAG TPA: YbdD/YjiX family protein [Gammaproteobacteria bacterium]|nr:YbdD/YjiX family protein [Gammaproteobacteria bacterium]
MTEVLKRAWRTLRELSGDDAYDRYLAHRRAEHVAAESPPLTRAEFYRFEQERKWDGVKRCC